MKEDTLQHASEEAIRFLVKVKEYRDRQRNDPFAGPGCKEAGAVKRASMDLSQALVDLRRGR